MILLISYQALACFDLKYSDESALEFMSLAKNHSKQNVIFILLNELLFEWHKSIEKEWVIHIIFLLAR